MQDLYFILYWLYFELCLAMYEGSMSFWQKLFMANQQHNEHKNQIACVENDCSCKSNDQLLKALLNAHDEDVIAGIKKVLMSRGFNKKELNDLLHPPIQ
ncbi:hypothetical protein L289_3557 [Acinetobacter gerneri DSM 14967 = CIP 107464 = MTCC 9824]|uniref:Uncharacterized protein n=2 Tax=Acinetobacter gerneri TaxID=202952 RepID=N8ZLZ2_9GAMM|nr:hypothetical protein F960_02973 [Acinetobacter gerneri DSM 14967 = CIP 107464 = MTCC 9824]EPR81695.1 hypothetical protein L289_3557 [Acinetobacter gerneri DSM 14967 = CIP 107464 = MTCC 9824]